MTIVSATGTAKPEPRELKPGISVPEVRKYTFGRGEAHAVECPKLDEFIAEFDALCEQYGISFYIDGDECTIGIEGYSQNAALYLIERALKSYWSGVPWLDEAKKCIMASVEKFMKVYQERDERALYERLRKKYGDS